MKQCEKCRQFIFQIHGGGYPSCHCKPFNIVDENGEEYGVIHADSDQSAALKFAEISNVDGDYHLMGESIDIKVNGKGFTVSAEPDIHYNASEL